LVVATVILYVAVVGAGFYVWNNSRNTKHALCTYRADLISRVIASTKFLSDHPQGIPGVSVKTFTDSINNQQHAILALRSLNCKDQP
jgi:hypothetical protein